ncbi:hypothetical protein E1202_01770 [Saccharopolyspora karakumensis]|uniref:Uncharacterized protein n=2 Tax=Saccharopolyspora TaxID=1835 RepID=A0A4R4WB84_9PSEU|nr:MULTISPECIES: hypothetical protein [Saccharopolyspora]TDD10610.1 hypothetical protein E1181_00865 [Saccharopolyspora terrae]TDD92736.1 hypothetical protein E1202_01770 [Saccharopolyspora karakumensis]
MHIVHVELSGKGVLMSLGVLAFVLAVLALVWLVFSPAVAIGIGVGLVLLVRGLIKLFSPAQ